MQPKQGQQCSSASTTRKLGWEELVLNEVMAPGTGITEPQPLLCYS